MRETLAAYCARMGRQDLLEQWDAPRNLPLTMDELSPGSHRKVWWTCGHGHRWQAQVNSRVSGSGCPVCAGRAILPGENDLATRHPALAAQWHPTKNGDLIPQRAAPGSRRKAWWVCEKGHEWQAFIASRTSGGTGCPVCAGKIIIPGENDLASRYPAIAAQWNFERNGRMKPQRVSPCSNRKVWWRCSAGHEYRATVASRTMRGGGCPYCAGTKVLAGFNDLASREPQVAAQWHPTFNGALTPEMVTAGSRRKVWWQCPLGHVWQAVIYSRTGLKKCGCPVCAGKVSEERQARYAKALGTRPAKTIQTAGDRV